MRSIDMQRLNVVELDTPVGPVTLVAGAKGLCALDFADRRDHVRRNLERRFGPVELQRQSTLPGIVENVQAYMAGDLRALGRVPVDPGGTPFQQRVWTELRRIPPGATLSYGELARAVGRPGAGRAVGMANARNPIAIVIPCHRVIGADGSLCGYAGGVTRKQWLLNHERRWASAVVG